MVTTHENQMDHSWYEATVDRADYSALQGRHEADVAVIGGGYTGLNAALELARAGVSVIVLEKLRLGGGASGSNGGQLCTGLHRTQPWIERKFGAGMARELWDIALEAKDCVRDTCEAHGIDADWRPGRLLLAHNKRSVSEVEEQAEYLAKHYNYSGLEVFGKARCAEFVQSDVYHGGADDRGAGHLHPLKLALGVGAAAARHGAQIHEFSAAESYEVKGGKVHVRTAGGEVAADKAVLAGNGYIGKLEPYLSRRLIPANDFLVATEPLGERAKALLPGNHAVSDTRYHMNYYRLSPDGRLLFGGAASTKLFDPPEIERRVRKNFLSVFPQLSDVKFEHFWSGTLGITVSQMPHFGVLQDRVYFAHGYSGLGVALANKGGAMVAQKILGNGAQFDTMARLNAMAVPGTRGMKNIAVDMAMAWYRVVDAL